MYQSWTDYCTKYRMLVEGIVRNLQHLACDYDKRHPKGPCDCKFGAVAQQHPEESIHRPIAVGVLTEYTMGIAPIGQDIEPSHERTGCPELRYAIELVVALPHVVEYLEKNELIHRTWEACVCEKCVDFREAMGLPREGAPCSAEFLSADGGGPGGSPPLDGGVENE